MFKLAVESGRPRFAPHVPMLEENNAGQGFVDHGVFLKVRERLPAYLKDPITFLYLSGWRLGEMRTLEWRDVDLAGRVVRLRPEISKNKDGRVLPLSGDLLTIVERAKDQRTLDCPYVFHLNGQQVGDFKRSWASACKGAHVGKVLVHDLRRTAVRNMVRAGIPDRISMALSGHKSRSVFDRYNIVQRGRPCRCCCAASAGSSRRSAASREGDSDNRFSERLISVAPSSLTPESITSDLRPAQFQEAPRRLLLSWSTAIIRSCAVRRGQYYSRRVPSERV